MRPRPTISISKAVLLSCLAHTAGGKEDAAFLASILGKQLKDPSDFVAATNAWSIFNVFASSDASSGSSPADGASTGALVKKAKAKARKGGGGEKGARSKDGKNTRTTTKKKSSGEEWSTVLEDGSEGGHNAELPLKVSASAAASGGLLPTAVYVINRDAEVAKWVQFRGRWSIVHSLSDLHRNHSAPNPALTPVRVRAADLLGAPVAGGNDPSGWASSPQVSWTRRLDVLPPKARRVALACRDAAAAKGPAALDALSYAVSHLALWESLATNPAVTRDSRLLILDDDARPRQGWRESLERLAPQVPKDWDVLLLGWWGRARSADRAPGSGGTVFRAKPPFRSREGGRRGEGPWQYYYAGAHARLVRGRVLKRLVSHMAQVAAPPRCKLLWPDGDAVAWAHQTQAAGSQAAVGYYALHERLFGVGDRLSSARGSSSGGGSSSSGRSRPGEGRSNDDDKGSRSVAVLAAAAKGLGYDEFERWVSQPAGGLASVLRGKAGGGVDDRGSFSGQGDDDDDEAPRGAADEGAVSGEGGEGSGGGGGNMWKARSITSDFVSSKTVRTLRAKLPPDVRCRTIVNHALGTEREACL